MPRIFVDSRHRTLDSPSASDFTIELLEPLLIPANARIRCHGICIPHAWYTVEAGINDRIYAAEQANNVLQNPRIVRIPPGQYDGNDVALMIQFAFNGGTDPTKQDPKSSTYTNGLVQVAYREQTGCLTFKFNKVGVFLALLSDDYVRANPSKFGVQPDALRSFNPNLRLDYSVYILGGGSGWTSEFLDLMPLKTIYIHCPTFGDVLNVGPRPGDTTVLSSVAVTASFGYVCHDEGWAWEFGVTRGEQLVKRLQFQLMDASGSIVPLHGLNWSCCITTRDPTDVQ